MQKTKTYDVAIIGAGINGVGVARELALRGLKVFCCDKGDIGSATSSASSKLIHGGLRYLEQGQFQLIMEALRERKYLLANAPHLTSVQPFLIPVYENSRVPFWKLKLGVMLYETLAFFHRLSPHKTLSRLKTIEQEPHLKTKDLQGGIVYMDGKMDDARVALETALQAKQFGADIRTYHSVIEIAKTKNHINSLTVKNTLTGDIQTVKAKQYVNTTGPWIDDITEKIYPKKKKKKLLRPSKGTHIVVESLSKHAIVLTSPSDGRVFFVIPYDDYSLIGTTDTEYKGNPSELKATKEDRDYLLKSTRHFFPKAALSESDIIASFSGIRPLVADTKRNSVGKVSREEKIIQHADNLWTLAGGKYTTYRLITEKLALKIAKKLGLKTKKSLTKKLPLYGGDIDNLDAYIKKNFPLEKRIYDITKEEYSHLIHRYGSAYQNVLSVIFEDESYKEFLPGVVALRGEVIYAIRHEMAKTISDFLRRRTPYFFQPEQGLNALSEVADLFQQELHWNDLEKEVAILEYQNFVSQSKEV